MDKQAVGFENLYDEPKLFLDDTRNLDEVYEYSKEIVYTYPKWDIVRSYNDFVAYIETYEMPKVISFDNDLGDTLDNMLATIEDPMERQEAWELYQQGYDEKTGYDCMIWLVNYCFDNRLVFPRILVHTQNTVGYDNIVYYYRNAIRNKMIRLR